MAVEDDDIPFEALEPEPRTAPARYHRRKEPVSPLGRDLPHSLDAEEYLLACCFIDGADTVRRCMEAKLSGKAFFGNPNEVIYETMLSVYQRKLPIDIAVIAEELKTSGKLAEVGGYAYLAQVSSRIPTTAQVSYFIDRVRDLHALREIIRVAGATLERAFEQSNDVAEFASDVEVRMLEATRNAREGAPIEATPLADFDYPEGDDSNILLGSDDYLGRGGGMLFVSHAGAGKSSSIMDACMSWAEGLPWMGIRSNGALTILIIQAEDSDRYIGKVSASYRWVNNIASDSPRAARLRKNVIIAKVKGKSGPAFFAELERLTRKHRPDLVVINPIYLYAQGDISKSECAQPFLVGLDHVNREEKFGYILVHHTGKPAPKGPNGKRGEVEDWETIYMGFGSSYLANWPRCSALLEPRPNLPGRYWLKLGKAGKNAGVTKEVEQGAGVRHEPVTKIALKHSEKRMTVKGRERPVIFWEPDVEEAPASEETTEKRPRGGREQQFTFSDFRSALRTCALGPAKRQGYNTLHRAANQVMAVSKGTFNRILTDAVDIGHLIKHPDDGKYYVPET